MNDHFSRLPKLTELTELAELRVGSVVRSRTGRDRKRIFLVVEIDSGNPVAPAVIANGTLRRLEDRKHKNPAHLEPVGVLGETETKQLFECLTNGKIAEICRRYDIS